MLKTIILFTLIATVVVFGDDFLSKFHQNDYKVKNFRGNTKWINENFTKFFKTVTYKYNRSTPATNVSFSLKTDIDENLYALVQFYKLARNQYRVFPVRFQVNFWDAIASDVVGLGIIYKDGHGNVPRGRYFKKDVVYNIYNFVPDESHMPPLFPTGEYMNDVTFIFKNEEIATIAYFAEVYRREV